MKKQILYIILIFQPCFLRAQVKIDSLERAFAGASNDPDRYIAVRGLYNYYEETNRDSALKYAGEGRKLAVSNNKKLAEILCLDNYGYQLSGKGLYAESLNALTRAFQLAEDKKTEENTDWPLFVNGATVNGKKLMLCYTHHIYAILMWQTQNITQEIYHFSEARRIAGELGFKPRMMMADMNLGRSYIAIDKIDTALLYELEAEKLALEASFKKYLGNVYAYMGVIYSRKGEDRKALQYFHSAIRVALQEGNLSSLSNNSYFGMARFYISRNNPDSALYYSLLNLETFLSLGNITGAQVNLGSIYDNIYQSYELKGNRDSAYRYQGLALQVKDSLYKLRIKSLADFQNINFREQLKMQEMEREKVEYRNKVRIWFLLGGIAVLLLLAIIFYRNTRQKLRAKLRIEKAYADLKATQAQLVHAEKMASLGELTAGIAHEIQNPLNFVNNFSELNRELAGELKQELATGNWQSAKEIADNIIANEEKINHHGRRADSIVKGMLQHSRSSSGQKEPTDINALCDEYLRLAYHGLRARDKSFNAVMKTEFDESIGTVSVISQDLGRVILNLITNAFYAVTEKKKQLGEKFEPVVTVSTRKKGNRVEIRVADNGMGIPKKILDKIFQPFFTTKPTGEGTGLGLSLSYDIITKGHGGELKADTKEGEFAEFIIILPS